MKVDAETFDKIKDLYGYAIAQEHVGRRVLMREFDISRSSAEEVLEEIRNPSVDPEAIIVIDSIQEYEYDDEEDIYTFYATDPFGEDCQFSEDGEVIRKMKKDYCMRDYTKKETALNSGYDPVLFDDIKKIFDWKHKSIPATEEKMRNEKAEEVAERLAMEQKKADARKELQKKKKRELRKDAKRWRKFDEVILEKIEGALGGDYQPPSVEITIERDEEKRNTAAVVPTFDVHFGKQGVLGPDGTPYNKGEAERRVIDSTTRLIKDLKRYNVEKIYLAFGSDFFHVDNHHGTTTGTKLNQGTAQDIDGLPGNIFNEGCDLMRKHIDMLRQIAEIDGLVIPGNHDRILSVALAKFLQGVYENAGDVQIQGDISSRKYRLYGSTLLGFDHGDSIRNNDILPILMTEAREMISKTENAAFFTGHLHQELVEDLGGATAYQVGSPSGADRWHEINGYVASQEQMTAFVIDEDTGIHAHLNYPVVL